jgi:polyisoprenoid-binding protein YceI
MKILHHFTSCMLLTVALTFSTVTTATAEMFVFDKNHTEIRFSWNHFGLSRMSGRFLVYDGLLDLDKAAPEKSTLNVKIDTSGLWTHVDKLNEHLKSADFFDVAKFPDITFESIKIERTGDKTAKLTGNLTIKGKTKPVTLDVTLNYNGAHPMTKKPTVAFSAKTAVKRTDFDLGKFAPAVSDEVTIEIETEMNAKE